MRPARAPFALGFALSAALAHVSGLARAESQPYELSYTAPPGCPAEAHVRAEVRANVRDATSGDGAHISLTIVAEGAGFTGELVALDRSGKQGRRSIQGPTCNEVGQTLAFLAALAIELGGRIEEEPVATAPTTAAPPTPPIAAKPALPQQSETPPGPEQVWRFSGLLGAGLRGGLAPSLRPSAEVGLDFGSTGAGLVAPSVRATLVGALSRISNSQGTAKLSLVAGRLEGCPLRFGSRALALRPCLGVELGAVFAQGELDGGRSVVQRWGSAEAGVRLETWLSRRVFVELEGAAMVPFFRTRYFFVPEHIVYVVPAVTGRVGLVAGYRF